MFLQILTFCKSLSRKNYKIWKRLCKRTWFLRTKNFPLKLEIFTKSKKQKKKESWISSPLVFLVMKISKNIQSMYQKNVVKKKHVDLLLIGEEDKRHYVLIKDFNPFKYDYILHWGRKHFCHYCLQAFSAEEILNINMPKKLNTLNSKTLRLKWNHHSWFMQGLKVF